MITTDVLEAKLDALDAALETVRRISEWARRASLNESVEYDIICREMPAVINGIKRSKAFIEEMQHKLKHGT